MRPCASSAGDVAAGAVILRRTARGQLRLCGRLRASPASRSSSRRAPPAISSFAYDAYRCTRSDCRYGPCSAADIRALVPVEPEPPQVLEDARLRLLRRSLGVGVLDAQDERAVLAVREQPVEERRAGVADVQLAGRTRGESNSHSCSDYQVACLGQPICATSATACAAMASPRPTASTPSFVFPLTLTRGTNPECGGQLDANRDR